MKNKIKSFISVITALALIASAALAVTAAPGIYSVSGISDTDVLAEAAETFVSLGIVKGKGTNENGEVIIDFASKITQQEMAMFMARTNTGMPEMFGSEEVLQYTSLPAGELKQNLGIADINPVFLGAVLYCYEDSIIPREMLNPEKSVTVAEAAEMIINALGYTDISNEAVTDKAVEIGLFAGFTEGFALDSAHELTRGEAIMLLYNFFNSDRQLVGMWWDEATDTHSPKTGVEPVRARFAEYAAERLDPETVNNQPEMYFTFENGGMKPQK
jgi:hypothetical protein